jgi:hypothetical protein
MRALTFVPPSPPQTEGFWNSFLGCVDSVEKKIAAEPL